MGVAGCKVQLIQYENKCGQRQKIEQSKSKFKDKEHAKKEDHLPGPSSRLTGLVWGGPMLGSSERGGNVTVLIIIIKILLVINMLSLQLSEPQSSHLRAWRGGR